MDENLGDTKRIGSLSATKAGAYEAVKSLSFTGAHFRTDIADRAMKRKG